MGPAVEAAHPIFAQCPWATRTATEQGKIPRTVGDAIAAAASHLAQIEVCDNGMLLSGMRGQAS